MLIPLSQAVPVWWTSLSLLPTPIRLATLCCGYPFQGHACPAAHAHGHARTFRAAHVRGFWSWAGRLRHLRHPVATLAAAGQLPVASAPFLGPLAKRKPYRRTALGVSWADDYSWMEEGLASADMRAQLRTEVAHHQRTMRDAGVSALATHLRQEMWHKQQAHLQPELPPERHGPYLYRTTSDENGAVRLTRQYAPFLTSEKQPPSTPLEGSNRNGVGRQGGHGQRLWSQQAQCQGQPLEEQVLLDAAIVKRDVRIATALMANDASGGGSDGGDGSSSGSGSRSESQTTTGISSPGVLDVHRPPVLGSEVVAVRLSRDQRRLAYLVPMHHGAEQYCAIVRDTDTGSLVRGGIVPGVAGVEFSADGRWLLCSTVDADTGRGNAAVLHAFDINPDPPRSNPNPGGRYSTGLNPQALGCDAPQGLGHLPARESLEEQGWDSSCSVNTCAAGGACIILLREASPEFYVQVLRTRDWRWLVVTVNSKSSSEVHLLDAADPAGSTLHCVQRRRPGLEYFVEHQRGMLYLLTNYRPATEQLPAPPGQGLQGAGQAGQQSQPEQQAHGSLWQDQHTQQHLLGRGRRGQDQHSHPQGQGQGQHGQGQYSREQQGQGQQGWPGCGHQMQGPGSYRLMTIPVGQLGQKPTTVPPVVPAPAVLGPCTAAAGVHAVAMASATVTPSDAAAGLGAAPKLSPSESVWGCERWRPVSELDGNLGFRAILAPDPNPTLQGNMDATDEGDGACWEIVDMESFDGWIVLHTRLQGGQPGLALLRTAALARPAGHDGDVASAADSIADGDIALAADSSGNGGAALSRRSGSNSSSCCGSSGGSSSHDGSGGGRSDDSLTIRMPPPGTVAVPLPPWALQLSPGGNADYYATSYRFTASSPVHAPVELELDFTTGHISPVGDTSSALASHTRILDGGAATSNAGGAGHDGSCMLATGQYTVQRMGVNSDDGTAVPLTILSQRGSGSADVPGSPASISAATAADKPAFRAAGEANQPAQNGVPGHTRGGLTTSNPGAHRGLAPEDDFDSGRQHGPLLLLAYGAYGQPYDLSYNPNQQLLLDRGWKIAIAYVRGGGELGRSWHVAARGPYRRHVAVQDYLACARYLHDRRYTGPGLMAGHATSAGALLLGHALAHHPDLFAAAILRVPFADALTCMLDPKEPLTEHERDEWGDPAADVQALAALQQLCPYQALLRVLQTLETNSAETLFAASAVTTMQGQGTAAAAGTGAQALPHQQAAAMPSEQHAPISFSIPPSIPPSTPPSIRPTTSPSEGGTQWQTASLRLPPLLVSCALDDAHVPFWAAAKWVAAARQVQALHIKAATASEQAIQTPDWCGSTAGAHLHTQDAQKTGPTATIAANRHSSVGADDAVENTGAGWDSVPLRKAPAPPPAPCVVLRVRETGGHLGSADDRGSELAEDYAFLLKHIPGHGHGTASPGS